MSKAAHIVSVSDVVLTLNGVFIAELSGTITKEALAFGLRRIQGKYPILKN